MEFQSISDLVIFVDSNLSVYYSRIRFDHREEDSNESTS